MSIFCNWYRWNSNPQPPFILLDALTTFFDNFNMIQHTANQYKQQLQGIQGTDSYLLWVICSYALLTALAIADYSFITLLQYSCEYCSEILKNDVHSLFNRINFNCQRISLWATTQCYPKECCTVMRDCIFPCIAVIVIITTGWVMISMLISLLFVNRRSCKRSFSFTPQLSICLFMTLIGCACSEK